MLTGSLISYLSFFKTVEQLQQAVDQLSKLSPESREQFLAAFDQWIVPKDHFLVREKEVADYIFFINKGIARIYYYKGGKEITEWIAMDGQFFLSITSFFENSHESMPREWLKTIALNFTDAIIITTTERVFII